MFFRISKNFDNNLYIKEIIMHRLISNWNTLNILFTFTIQNAIFTEEREIMRRKWMESYRISKIFIESII